MRRLSRRGGVAVCAALGVLLASCGIAQAAFPGRSGRLAVEPLSGPGVVLVGTDGRGATLLCGRGSACSFGVRARPAWSPDGRSLLLSTSRGVGAVYPDGSCLDCQPVGGSAGVFTSNSTLTTVVSGGNLVEYGVDGVYKKQLIGGGVASAAWSSGGRLAVVRRRAIWVGKPGALRRLGAGSAPAWSPDGRRIAFVRAGWVMVGRASARSFKRLAKGSAPAWSPGGSSIVFIGKRQRVSLISGHGGQIRNVGNVRGKAVDWQPMPASPPSACAAPPGSKVIASDATAVLTTDAGPAQLPYPGSGLDAPAYMGCLRADGRERLLARYDYQTEDGVQQASDGAVAGNYAGLVVEQSDPHYGGDQSAVHVFDLGTGSASPHLGGESASCPDYSHSCSEMMDGLVLNDQGFAAVHLTLLQANPTEEIQASDSSGSRTVDSAATTGNQDVLTNLTLTGNTLSWNHDGTPESTELH